MQPALFVGGDLKHWYLGGKIDIDFGQVLEDFFNYLVIYNYIIPIRYLIKVPCSSVGISFNWVPDSVLVFQFSGSIFVAIMFE